MELYTHIKKCNSYTHGQNNFFMVLSVFDTPTYHRKRVILTAYQGAYTLSNRTVREPGRPHEIHYCITSTEYYLLRLTYGHT